MAKDNSVVRIMTCCLILVVSLAVSGCVSSTSPTGSSSITDDSLANEESLPILNMTNVTVNDAEITFVYYDHNTTRFEGCYGLNYSVVEDGYGNRYMLDHATTDIFGEKTDYTFKYPDGMTLVFDNNTQTQIYEDTGLYYVHELQDENKTPVKSLANFTLNDKSHQPSFIPTNWTFVYFDHNATQYEGDDGLSEVITGNAIGNHEENVRLSDDIVIGLMYYSNNSTDYYRYGFSGFGFDNLEEFRVNGTSINGYYDHGYYLSRFSVGLPNGTKIRSFNIETKYLSQAEKNFLQDYQNRRDEYLMQENTNAVYDAADDYYTRTTEYSESQKNKNDHSIYYGTNGYGVIVHS